VGDERPVGVIDIGSNSVRLVIFDGPHRAPMTVFNEKTLCGLGAGVAATGALDAAAAASAEDAIRRYAAVAKGMGVGRLRAIANSATREASNGQACADRIGAIIGQPVEIITGAPDARLAALGVIAGFPDARGMVGDLGGGSLELAAIDGRELREGLDAGLGGVCTLPLGPLSLRGEAGDDGALARRIVDDAIAGAFDGGQVDADAAAEAFFPVGGAWRALAKLHIAQSDYPLRVLHHYEIEGGEAQRFAELVARQSKSSIMAAQAVSRRRAETLPLAALVLARTLARTRPARVVFSAFGLREGAMFEMADHATRLRDPLTDLADRVGVGRARDPRMGDALMRFVDPLYPDEAAADRRLRAAACALADIGWRQHPDYRADMAFTRVLLAPVSGADHAERAFVAHAVHQRYGGDADGAEPAATLKLLDPDRQAAAHRLGRALRLGFAYAASSADLLDTARLDVDAETVTLRVARGRAEMLSDTVRRRLDQCAKAFGRAPKAVVDA